MVLSGGLTTQLAGFWIQPTYNTSTNKGDGQWYEISSVSTGTTATLARGYGGSNIASGTAASTIAQTWLLPEAYQHLPEAYASYRYWMKENDTTRAGEFKSLVVEGMSSLFTSYGYDDLSMVIDWGDERPYINPNLTISL